MFPKLFVTDLDGTALGGGFLPYARFPDHFSQFLDYLNDNGCKWGINTTWDVNGQWDLVEISSVKTRPVFYMAEFGLRLAHDSAEGPEFVQPYVDDMNKKLDKVLEAAMYPLVKDISNNFKPSISHFYGHLFSFECVDEEKELMDAYVKENHSTNELLLVKCENGRLGVRPRFMNKGLALSKSLELLEISPDDVVVAGDETTDIAMMCPELAKFAVCPENSADKVKEHVLEMGGKVGMGHSSKGVINAFEQFVSTEFRIQ